MSSNICPGYYVLLKAHRFPRAEQIMSADKYPSILLRQMEAIVYLKSIQNFPSNAISLKATKRVTCLNSLTVPQLKLGDIRVIFQQS